MYFYFIHPSIHPSSQAYPSWWWQQAKQAVLGLLLSSNPFQLLLVGLLVLPGQAGYVIPPARPGPTPDGHARNNSKGRHPDQMLKPSQLAHFDAKEPRLYSLRISELLALFYKAKPSHALEEPYLSCLYLQPCPFGHR